MATHTEINSRACSRHRAMVGNVACHVLSAVQAQQPRGPAGATVAHTCTDNRVRARGTYQLGDGRQHWKPRDALGTRGRNVHKQEKEPCVNNTRHQVKEMHGQGKPPARQRGASTCGQRKDEAGTHWEASAEVRDKRGSTSSTTVGSLCPRSWEKRTANVPC